MKTTNNAFLVSFLCLLIMLLCICIMTTLVLFASRALQNKELPADTSAQTTGTGNTTTPNTTTQEIQSDPPDPSTDNTGDSSVSGDLVTPKKKIAFTFDDGPNGTLTYKFVDKLKEYGASATFFVVGNRMGQSNGAALQYVIDSGCEVGLHSFSHAYYNKMTLNEFQNDLKATNEAIKKYVSVDIKLMRPPGGILSSAQKQANPYTAILWSVDSNDWQYTGRSADKKDQNVQTIVQNVLSVVKEGDIVLMHELYENSYEAFCIIIEELYSQGYELVTVSELLGDDRIVPGVSYYNGR